MASSPKRVKRIKLTSANQREAAKYLNLRELFPHSKVNSRTKLTAYQEKKIIAAMNEAITEAGGYGVLQRDFVPLKNAKAYNKKTGRPGYMKGVFFAGGSRDNKEVEYKGGKVSYTRGGTERTFIPLNNWSERILVKELRVAVADLPDDGKKYLAANGRMIRNSQAMDEGALEANAKFIFNKYKDMAARGEIRTNGAIAAHPKKWGIGILYEAPMTAAQAWIELTDEQQAGWDEGRIALKKKSNFEAFKKVYNTTMKRKKA